MRNLGDGGDKEVTTRRFAMRPNTLICGIDEVGRGSLAGPILSVAALFTCWDVGCSEVTDSKKLTPKSRRRLFPLISRSKTLIDFGIGIGTVEEINNFGIDFANEQAFIRAVNSLPVKPNWLIVDGVKGVPDWSAKQDVVPKADDVYPVVGAASIIAKVIRDDMMIELSEDYPDYAWGSNKGYGSKAHREALQVHGWCEHHRLKFISNIVPLRTGACYQ
jgi:ribonuclease HII